MFLVTVDAHSKPGVFLMKSTTTEKIVSALRTIFTRNGLPEQMVSDNGQQFTSEESSLFKQHQISEVSTSPSSNERVSCKVCQNLSKSIKAMDSFLFVYRNTVHAATSQTPRNAIPWQKSQVLH